MKLRLPVSLLSLALSGLCFVSSANGSGPTYTTDLGNVMYVGDSITHGVNSASYRWELHKIFVDNGISSTSIGVMTGNYSGGVSAGTQYGGVVFNNVHSSQASARAYEIAGRQGGSKYGRFEYSNIQNWLGQSTVKNNNQTYSGTTFTGDDTPDTVFLLIGTNDLLSDISSNTLPTQLATIQTNLLGEDGKSGDMGTILSSVREANADSQVIVLNIPCWTTHSNNNAAATHEAVASYNEALETWASQQENVTLVNVNKGMLDVASETPFAGCSSMFNNPGSDGLHPNAQGDLIMAGNVAQAMGYAGRSVGQERLAASELAVNIEKNEVDFTTQNVTLSSGTIDLGAVGESSISYSWAEADDLAGGFTLDLGTVQLGDGSASGWNTTQDLSISLGAEDFYGTLNINEAYIKWGDTVLYSTDMSQNTDTLRVSWLAGNSLEGISSGYYVWLGDMLIGEALDSTYASGHSGLSITYSGSGTATLTELALGTGSYAPTTTGLVGEAAFVSSGPILPATKGEPQGGQDWVGGEVTHSADSLTVSATYNARSQADSTTGAAGNVVETTITTGSTTIIYGNSGNYTGDVWTTISAEGGASSWFAAHGGSGTLTGDANLRFTDDAVGGSTVFGAVNATKVTGDVYVELSAAKATFGTFTNTAGKKASLVGSYATDVGGNVDLVVNSGTLSYHVVGGIYTGNKTISGSASVYINGGTIGGKVMGGGYSGTINGGTSVTITDGVVSGDVFGGGSGGTINVPALQSRAAASLANPVFASHVELTGGTIEGNVYGGGEAGSINGNTGVTIIGSAVRLHNGAAWVSINGGGSGGTITGDSIITLKDIAATNDGLGFDKYAGTIDGGSNVSGTRSLVLDNVQLESFGAVLSNFDSLYAVNGTKTTLTSFGGANLVSIGDDCVLTVVGTYDKDVLIQMGENSTLTVGWLSGGDVVIDITDVTNFTISMEADKDISNITFKDGDNFYAAMLTDVDTQANTGRLVLATAAAAIPEPATATLSLLGLAALAMRRRRR